LEFRDGSEVSLHSPRLQTALLEAGVELQELRPLSQREFRRRFCPPGTLAEVSAVRWEAVERDRLGHLRAVLDHRQRAVEADQQAKLLADKQSASGAGGAGFSAGGGGDREGAVAAAAAEPDSSMVQSLLADVEKMKVARQKRLDAEERLAAQAAVLAQQRSVEQARREQELGARAAAAARVTAARQREVAAKVERREARMRQLEEVAQVHEQESIAEQEEQLAVFRERRSAFVRARRRKQREVERRNAAKVERSVRVRVCVRACLRGHAPAARLVSGLRPPAQRHALSPSADPMPPPPPPPRRRSSHLLMSRCNRSRARRRRRRSGWRHTRSGWMSATSGSGYVRGPWGPRACGCQQQCRAPLVCRGAASQMHTQPPLGVVRRWQRWRVSHGRCAVCARRRSGRGARWSSGRATRRRRRRRRRGSSVTRSGRSGVAHRRRRRRGANSRCINSIVLLIARAATD
jgi:hypothetical protein